MVRNSVETDISGDLTPVPGLVGARAGDLVLLNDRDLTYAKIRLDDHSLATLLDGVDHIADSLARALCWNAAWDMTRDGQLRASDFVTLVLRGVGLESDITAVTSLLRQAHSSLMNYAAPEHRPLLRDAWERGVRLLLDESEHGSDQQLALLRGYATAAHSDEALDLCRGLLEDDALAASLGLDVDTDLRWTLTTALAREGWFDDSDIDRELGRDETISGREHAAAARATLPTVAAKQRSWHDAVATDDLPAQTRRRIAMAFSVPGQEDLLEPYLEPYLAMADTVWEDRGVHMASSLLVFLFPRTSVKSATIERVERWLAGTAANPAARRLVEEGVSDLRRAMAAQAFDAAESARR